MAKELVLIPKTKNELLNKCKQNVSQYVLQPTEESPTSDEVSNRLEICRTKKNLLNKALGLWNYLKDRRGPLLNWDEHGELTIKGITVRGSHLSDLLKHTLSALSQQKPIGYDQFKAALEEMLAPMGFIAHKMETSESQAGLGYVKGKTERVPPGRKQFRWIPY